MLEEKKPERIEDLIVITLQVLLSLPISNNCYKFCYASENITADYYVKMKQITYHK